MSETRKGRFGETVKLGTSKSARPPRPTPRGEALPETRIAPPRPAKVPDDATTEVTLPKAAGASAIEVKLVTEGPAAEAVRKGWRAIEVWTKHHIYGMDTSLTCTEILERTTGKPAIGHAMIGARLGGGRLRQKDAVHFAYPFPVPGMEAMFAHGRKHGYTSAVERVVVRVRILVTSPDDAQPSWEEIANRWSLPPKQ